MQSVTPINIYHRWIYKDEICAALNHDLIALAKRYNRTPETIKTLRALVMMNGIGQSIMKSFNHPDQPAYIDQHRKEEWQLALNNVLQQWHNIFHLFLTQQIQSAHASTDMQEWQTLIDDHFITSITNDQHLDPVKIKYAYIEPFFRGIHQSLEVAMNVMIDIVEQVRMQLKNLKLTADNHIHADEKEHLLALRDQLYRIQKWWVNAAEHILLLSKMDTGSYAEYRQALLGTSGGDSKQLRLLKSLMTHLHFDLPISLQDKSVLVKNFSKHPDDYLLTQLLSAIREAQAAATDFWLRHFTLTANTIGMIRGSQGLPVQKLISFALEPLLKNDSLLKSVGDVGEYYAHYPEAVTVNLQESKKIIGNTIYPHIKEAATFIQDYRTPAIKKPSLLDGLELKPLDVNDTHMSPYASWFDTNIHSNGLAFNMHSFGTPLTLFKESIANTANRLMESQNQYWETYFQKRLPAFQHVLFDLLQIPNDETYRVNVDANATAFIERLFSAMPKSKRQTILTTDQEFMTVNRALAANVIENASRIERVAINTSDLNVANAFKEAVKNIGEDLKLVIFSQVMSNTQFSMTAAEITDILNAVPIDIPVIIDIVQGVCNVPMNWGNILANRRNVYLVGSGIKHGRSSSGLGFLIFPAQNSLLQHPVKSGWCAYLSGLSMSTTTDARGQLLYDDEQQWLGGTPGNVFALELFINTWEAMLNLDQTLPTMHQYVQSLHQYLLTLLPKQASVLDAVRRLQFPETASNTIALAFADVSASHLMQHAAQHGILIDQRQQHIRVGFGIQHGKQDVEKLVEVLIGCC